MVVDTSQAPTQPLSAALFNRTGRSFANYHHGQNNLRCRGSAWSTSFLSFCCDSGVCRTVSDTFFSSLLSLPYDILPFLKDIFPEASPADRLSCVLWWIHWSWLEPAVLSVGQPLTSSHRGHTFSPCQTLPPVPNAYTYLEKNDKLVANDVS